jgi:hypothetical protein
MSTIHDTGSGAVRFPPARRFRYWPVSLTIALAGLWVMWAAGLPDLLRDFGGRDWWSRFFQMLVMIGSIPLLGATLMLFVPFRRLHLTVRPDGLDAVTSGGREVRRVDWSAVERIVYRRPRSVGALEFHFREGPGPRLWRLRDDCYAGGPKALLAAIVETAPAGGWALKGHRLDIAHWGGEEWRLERAP